MPLDASVRLAAAVEGGLKYLRLEPDARNAIIKCYSRFEEALAGVELPRRLFASVVCSPGPLGR